MPKNNNNLSAWGLGAFLIQNCSRYPPISGCLEQFCYYIARDAVRGITSCHPCRLLALLELLPALGCLRLRTLL